MFFTLCCLHLDRKDTKDGATYRWSLCSFEAVLHFERSKISNHACMSSSFSKLSIANASTLPSARILGILSSCREGAKRQVMFPSCQDQGPLVSVCPWISCLVEVATDARSWTMGGSWVISTAKLPFTYVGSYAQKFCCHVCYTYGGSGWYL